ncbi:MAG: pseudouridine-5'-phosphate glycosidase, partial [Shimia sp.]
MLNIAFSAEVRAALDQRAPVVALESTIITHGMPHPQNLEMARTVEATIREESATPATIAVMEGVLHVGLEDEALEALAQTENALKLSRADLPVALAKGQTGATTVAATMIAAHAAEIEVFATGGIGGVHRGAELSFDISADL